ncbi:MAG: nucleotidyltransferase domain-containing protein [Caldilineaceae bacterium SB0670_bin_27]|uniref:Nucleotidyltransferase domain-containing protein n=1 Tax=Caldilineaceae bacterium SB0664_bin_27 TaxID=2605260 RepID=A0A6B0YQW2_9CHLR|nr:nucleotidyltransferase domain-containing protein [Caldilineaceae bacterium SB0664_bin_27]MYJ77158.1 nucleotidyltransferase domain-containing protein [Caldilineaceae bacterium SB0670_bin_27]
MTHRLHLRLRHRRMLENILRAHLPDVEVWAYGSRISGASHDGSDLDLVLRSPELNQIPVSKLADLDKALRESTIPFLIEARDWARLPENFHCEIIRDHVVLLGPSGRLK